MGSGGISVCIYKQAQSITEKHQVRLMLMHNKSNSCQMMISLPHVTTYLTYNCVTVDDL